MEKKCPIEYTLSLLNGKWKIIILKELNPKALRYGALTKQIPGISSRILIQQLREMEEDGIINRTVYAEVPTRVEYSLSEKGKSLFSIFVALRTWGLDKGDEETVACKFCSQCDSTHFVKAV